MAKGYGKLICEHRKAKERIKALEKKLTYWGKSNDTWAKRWAKAKEKIEELEAHVTKLLNINKEARAIIKDYKKKLPRNGKESYEDWNKSIHTEINKAKPFTKAEAELIKLALLAMIGRCTFRQHDEYYEINKNEKKHPRVMYLLKKVETWL